MLLTMTVLRSGMPPGGSAPVAGVAVASLADMACVILPENIRMEKESLEKAAAEGLAVLTTPLSAYGVCGRMAAAGIPERT